MNLEVVVKGSSHQVEQVLLVLLVHHLDRLGGLGLDRFFESLQELVTFIVVQVRVGAFAFCDEAHFVLDEELLPKLSDLLRVVDLGLDLAEQVGLE